ncbi:MAG TPA: Fe-S cluster assembly protein SufD [Candidatus Saccharimonadales bacterium]|nr:Fe-S cluster assembly protein SufD [Candidatus Saccharimonadales bacterium]
MIETLQVKKEADPYLSSFDRFERDGLSNQPGWIRSLRKGAVSRFAEFGFPSLQDENWRFTNVAPIARLPFQPVLEMPSHSLTTETLEQFHFANQKSSRLVFVDGHYAAEFSSVLPLPAGVQLMTLNAAIAENVPGVEKHLGKYAQFENNSFTALHTAFFTDGLYIHVQSGTAVPDPVQLIFISTCSENGSAVHPRNLVIAEANSSLTLIESYVSLGKQPSVTNAVIEFVIGENAHVEHCKFQDEQLKAFHIQAIQAQLGRRANFISHSLALGAQLSRTNINTVLGGEGIECILNGLYITKDDQLADHFMIVDHAKPHCNSHEYFNGILDGRSKGVFHGRILVRQEAQKTDAKQTNKNLLLSDNATATAKPQLEIYADDVKCTHGATIGQLNDESIFYLRARGIGLETARRMLIHAFAGEIIDRIRCAPLREEIDAIVWDRLEQNPHVGEK